MEWCDYYDRMFEWAESTRVRRISDLTEFGDSEEVLDAAMNFDEEKNASKFVIKALSAGVRFTPEQTIDLLLSIDKVALSKVAVLANGVFTREQLDDLYLSIDDESFRLVSRKAGIDIFKDDEEEDAMFAYSNCNKNSFSSRISTPATVTTKSTKKRKPSLKTWMRLFKSIGSLGRALNPTKFMPLTYKEKRRRAQAKARRNRPWWDR